MPKKEGLRLAGMNELRYKSIQRTMSEINEELDKVSEICKDAEIGGLVDSTVRMFCDWLCGLSNVKLSEGCVLSKFAIESILKGVPPEDIGEFIMRKLTEMISKDLKERLEKNESEGN